MNYQFSVRCLALIELLLGLIAVISVRARPLEEEKQARYDEISALHEQIYSDYYKAIDPNDYRALLLRYEELSGTRAVKRLIEWSRLSENKCNNSWFFGLKLESTSNWALPSMSAYLDSCMTNLFAFCRDKLSRDLEVAINSLDDEGRKDLELVGRAINENKIESPLRSQQDIAKFLVEVFKLQDPKLIENAKNHPKETNLAHLLSDSFNQRMNSKILANRQVYNAVAPYWSIPNESVGPDGLGDFASVWLPRLRILREVQHATVNKLFCQETFAAVEKLIAQ